MKRFLFVFICVLAFSMTAYAQDFALFSVEIPSGYTAVERNANSVAINSDTDTSAGIIVDFMFNDNASLQTIAEYYYNGNITKTSDLNRENSGTYYFTIRNRGGVEFTIFVDDHDTDERIAPGYVRVIYRSESVSDSDFNTVYSSFASLIPVENHEEEFSRFSLTIPGGYMFFENEDKSVTIRRASGSFSGFSILLVANVRHRSLYDYALDAYNLYDHTSELRQNASGAYYFDFQSESDVEMHALVDDHTTDSRIPSGYVRVFYNADNVIESDYNLVYSSFKTEIEDADTPSYSHDFILFTATVPRSYNHDENSTGSDVVMTNNFGYGAIFVYHREQSANQTLANFAFSRHGNEDGTTSELEQNSSGSYVYTLELENGTVFNALFDDHNTDQRVPSGYFRMIYSTQSVMEEDFQTFYTSYVSRIAGNEENNNPGGEENNNPGGDNPGGNENNNNTNRSSASSSGGGCDFGLGIFALGLLIFARKKK